jgi:hypothetical protein
MTAFSESRFPEVKYGYFLDDPSLSLDDFVASSIDLGIGGGGGAEKSDKKPSSLGIVLYVCMYGK